MIAVRYS